jgi:hypothetical protein
MIRTGGGESALQKIMHMMKIDLKEDNMMQKHLKKSNKTSQEGGSSCYKETIIEN